MRHQARLGARLCAALLALAALAGCAASYQPMGAAVQPGRLADDALVAADGTRLALRSWLPAGPPRAALIALHGMNDYSHAFDEPAAAWASAGVATYAFDQRGFGTNAQPGIWADTATLVADLEAAVDAVGARHPGLPLYLLGESMGGAVVVAALAAPAAAGAVPLARRVSGAVLAAPALWGRQTMNPLFRLTLWAGYHLMPAKQLRPPATLKIRPSDNLEMLRALGRDPLVLKQTRLDALKGLVDLMSQAHAGLEALPPGLPVLVLYGMHEEVLGRSSVTATIERLRADAAATRTRVAVYENGYHMLLRDLCAPIVWRDVLAWLDDPAAPLPSAADQVAWRPRAPKARAGFTPSAAASDTCPAPECSSRSRRCDVARTAPS